jgi:hypothetical protein
VAIVIYVGMGNHMSVRNGLVACGIAVLVAAGAAACGSSGGAASTGAASTGGGSNGGASSAGGSGTSAGSSLPSWAKSLGAGVQVIAPGATAAGNSTPADVVTGLVDAIKAKNYPGICQYYEPSQQASCKSDLSQATAAELGTALADFATVKPTYTVIDGSQALVGATGTVCDQSDGKCSTNSDPAAILDSGKPFSQLWQTAVNSTGDAYQPIPVVKVNGQWYGESSGS